MYYVLDPSVDRPRPGVLLRRLRLLRGGPVDAGGGAGHLRARLHGAHAGGAGRRRGGRGGERQVAREALLGGGGLPGPGGGGGGRRGGGGGHGGGDRGRGDGGRDVGGGDGVGRSRKVRKTFFCTLLNNISFCQLFRKLMQWTESKWMLEHKRSQSSFWNFNIIPYTCGSTMTVASASYNACTL